MIVDSHCHLHAPYADADDGAYARMRQAGVEAITIGTTLESSRAATAYAQSHEGVWAAVGVHPCHAHTATLHGETEGITAPEQMAGEVWLALAREGKVVAIGEVGLDLYRVSAQMRAEVLAAQEQVLAQAIALATAVGKPLVCHVRDAHDRMVVVLREATERGALPKRGVIHCFTGTPEEAQAYLDLGFSLSLPGILTFTDRKSPSTPTAIQMMAAALPLDRLLVETDAPFLAPEPYRGARNEPAFVWETAKCLARLHGVSVEEVARRTRENAQRLFTLA
jgi:TatD DNase family protein